MYQITSEQTIAIAVPITLPMKPKIDCPEVIDMPIAFVKSDDEAVLRQGRSSKGRLGLQAKEVLTIIIIAHTNRCSMKKVCVSFKKATIPLSSVSQVQESTRN